VELQLGRLDEAQLRRIVAIEAEVVHRIAIDRVQRDFLAIEETPPAPSPSGRHDVTIREDQAALGVDDEAGRLARHIPFGVERARWSTWIVNNAGGNRSAFASSARSSAS
jgi:hypothetical protein